MNARGSTEVIVATIGLSMGALSPNLFTMIVAMAVITTMAMPPTLRWALARLPMRKDEKQRLEREEMEAKGFVPHLERLLLAVDESANGKFATRIAGMLAGHRGMPTTMMQIKTDKKTGKAAAAAQKEKAKETGQTIKDIAEQTDTAAEPKEEKAETKLDVTTIVENKPKAEAVAAEAEKGYGLMIVGLEKTVARRNQFHDDITNLAAGFEGPLAVVDAREVHLDRSAGIQAQHPGADQRHRYRAPRRRSRDRAGARRQGAADRALCRARRPQQETFAAIRGSDPQGHRRAGGNL